MVEQATVNRWVAGSSPAGGARFDVHIMSSIHSKDYRELIARLKDARIKANVTQGEVAKKLNKQQSFVSKVENCERRLDVLELGKFAKVYGVDISKQI